MKKPVIRPIALSLCAALAIGGIGVAAYASNSDSADEPEEAVVEQTASAASVTAEGDETIYVLSDADGKVNRVMVSDGVSSLTEESTTDDLPISVAVSYKLDGKDVSPEELAGKSGSVTIRFDYTNNRTESVTLDGKKETMFVPYAAITGLVLDETRFSNVAVTSGKVLSDGSRLAVIGMAFPGLQDNLALDTDTYEFPAYVEITADVTDFSLDMTLTLATSSVFSEIDLENTDSFGELTDSLSQLTDAMEQLTSGADELCNGLTSLLSGAESIQSGVGQLSAGLDTLSANSASLTGGAYQVFTSLTTMANTQIAAAGLEVPTLTPENYSSVLGSIIGSLDEDSIVAAARAKVEAAVREQEEAVRTAVTAAVEQQVTSQVQAAVRAQVQANVIAAMGLNAEELTDDQAVIVTATVDAQMQSADVAALITANTAQQMQSETVQQLIASKTEEQIQLLVDQQMASADVQAQINAGLSQASAGVSQLQSLKAQLDSYNAFYKGIISYTAGVDQAASGARELNAAMPEFISGTTQLRDGAQELSDGLKQFDEEGISKLTSAFSGDSDGLIARLKATVQLSKDENTDSEVKYIYKTAEIG
jgi:putative membrane protein